MERAEIKQIADYLKDLEEGLVELGRPREPDDNSHLRQDKQHGPQTAGGGS